MEQFAKGVQSALNWIAEAPPGILGLIAVVLLIMILARHARHHW